MQPPIKFDRAGAKTAGWTDEEIDAYLAQKAGAGAPITPSESTAVTPKVPEGSTAVAPRETTPAEHLVGATRAAMNRLTFGQYPKMVGAVNRMLMGSDADADAKRLAEFMATYKQQNPTMAATGEIAGEIAPYLAAGPIGRALKSIAPSALRTTPSAVSAAGKAAQAGYAALKRAPMVGRALPASGKMAAEIATIEGARGATDAEPGENRIAAAAKGAAGGLALGRVGEVAGTYAAGKLGPSISKMAAEAQQTAQEAGRRINQWRETATVNVTKDLQDLYKRSKPLREAIDQTAESLGLPANHPAVLQQAYSALSAEATPVFREQILTPFMNAIDAAASAPLSVGTRAYNEAQDLIRSLTRGKRTGQYLRSGAGEAEKVGPEVLTERMNRPYVTDAERQAAAAGLIGSIGERMMNVPTTLVGMGKSALQTMLTGGPRGVAQIADIAQQLGGGLPAQRLMQRTGTVGLASRSPRR